MGHSEISCDRERKATAVTFFHVVLVVLVVIAVWLVLRAEKVADARREEESWLPLRLRGATLKFSEKKFFDDGRLPLVAQVDRVYLTVKGSRLTCCYGVMKNPPGTLL